MSDQIDRIIDGLSEAQRDAIRGVYSFASPWDEDEGERGLHQLGIWKTYRIHSGETHWTELGQRVRARLLERDGGE
jgi:hypothetical protein